MRFGIGALRTALRLRSAYRMMKSDFLPPAPDLRTDIMAAVRAEPEKVQSPEHPRETDPVSLRNWVIVGLTIAASLILSPLGGDFIKMNALLGSDLLLPVALTLGMAISLFGALLIGSHLKELKSYFGLSRG